MMSEDSCHCIFYQFDGERSAHAIKDFFSGRRYNVQFSLQTLQNANIRHVSNLGVFILLLTPESYDLIKSQKHIDLNAIFPSPEFSVVLIYSVEKTMTDITTLLYSRIRDFSKWKILEYSSMPSLGIQIMELIEQFEEKCRRVSLQQKVQVWPREGIKSHSEVLLIFTEPVDNDSVVSFVQEWDGVNGTAERQNHMTFCFTVGDMKPGENKVEVFVNDTSIGRVELHGMSMESTMAVISNILHNVTNPVEFICQCLHITPSNREGLDSGLEELLSNRNSSFSDIFETVYSEKFGDFHSNYELPTLLHFCAKYGLTRSGMKLLRLPRHDEAIKMKNKDGLLPYQIAQNEGFDHLASVLKNSDNVSAYLGETRRIIPKAPTYVQSPLSPFGGEANVVKRNLSPLGVETKALDTNNGPQPCIMYQTNALRSSRSSENYLQPVQRQRTVTDSHINPVRRPDSGLGEETHLRDTHRQIERPQPCTPSTRERSYLHETTNREMEKPKPCKPSTR